ADCNPLYFRARCRARDLQDLQRLVVPGPSDSGRTEDGPAGAFVVTEGLVVRQYAGAVYTGRKAMTGKTASRLGREREVNALVCVICSRVDPIISSAADNESIERRD